MCPEEGIPISLGSYNGQVSLEEGAAEIGSAAHFDAKSTFSGDYDVYPVAGDDKCCEKEKCLKAYLTKFKGEKYGEKDRPQYRGLWRNSNSFVAGALKQCGMKFNDDASILLGQPYIFE